MGLIESLKDPSEPQVLNHVVGCLCAEIDDSDRPCIDCEEYDCDACRVLERLEASDEIERLAEFLKRHYPAEPGRYGHTESTVDVAIRLLSTGVR